MTGQPDPLSPDPSREAGPARAKLIFEYQQAYRAAKMMCRAGAVLQATALAAGVAGLAALGYANHVAAPLSAAPIISIAAALALVLLTGAGLSAQGRRLKAHLEESLDSSTSLSDMQKARARRED